MDKCLPILYTILMSLPAPSLLLTLREETRGLHEALHVHPLLAPLTQDIRHDQYHRALQAFHLAYRHMQDAVVYTDPEYPDAPALDWLERDMATHGVRPVEITLTPLPAIGSRSALLGYLYVKQGSTLGGQVISRHLARKLGLEGGVTNHFFAGYGEDTGRQWKIFVQALDDAKIDAETAVMHACASFQCITESCDKALHAS